ncbi:MAG TPA: GNAT family N-acetyltransferase [Acidimicrobiales bacterium]|nr:GNAT family N-acetyltransferase [Acidimicrobiales bacterium]
MLHDAPIETSRLHLVLLLREALELLRDGNVNGAEAAQGLDFTSDFLASVNESFLTRQLEGLRQRPSSPGWFVRGILRKDDNLLIGHCGFHGAPDLVGRAEIGYTIFARYRRLGYGVESARGLVEWARAQGTPVVYAAVSPDNISSMGLLTKIGFQRSSVRADGNDGELVFELNL